MSRYRWAAFNKCGYFGNGLAVLPARHRSRPFIRDCAAFGKSSNLKKRTFTGMYGPWRVEDSDIAEVVAYRVGLSALAATAAALFVNVNFQDASWGSTLDLLCSFGAGSFGLSLALIHIYVQEIKRTIQVLFIFGAVGAGWLAFHEQQSVIVYVIENPTATLLVGPAFAALTAVAIKEGLCYGKAEAAVLALITPIWLLGHLIGALPAPVEAFLAGCFCTTLAVFAARKYSQPIPDDIGDKSIFMVQAMPSNEQEAFLASFQVSADED